MALWHWLLGGAAAYLLISKTSAAAATQPSATTAQQMATTAASLEIMNYVNKAMGVATGYSVVDVPTSGGYAVVDPANNVITPYYPTLAQLLAQVKVQYPMAGWY